MEDRTWCSGHFAPGLAIDQPVSVTRYEYKDHTAGDSLTWPTFTIMVFWDYRGTPTYELYTNGKKDLPFASGGTSCPIGIATPQRCVLLQWAFAGSAYEKARGGFAYGSWLGTMLRNKQDGSGFEYMQNRVYDPKTGRFTQEDPIGLAGGSISTATRGETRSTSPIPLDCGFAFAELRLRFANCGAARRMLLAPASNLTGRTACQASRPLARRGSMRPRDCWATW